MRTKYAAVALAAILAAIPTAGPTKCQSQGGSSDSNGSGGGLSVTVHRSCTSTDTIFTVKITNNSPNPQPYRLRFDMNGNYKSGTLSALATVTYDLHQKGDADAWIAVHGGPGGNSIPYNQEGLHPC
jgi:hypothetical protein